MVTGRINKISYKDWNDPKSGDTITLYSIKLNGDDKYYRTGSKNPANFGAKQGAMVSFEINEKGNVNVNTIKTVKEDAAGREAASAAAGASTKDSYWSKKEARDVEKDANYQKTDIPRMTFCGAQDSAIALVKIALEQGAIDLGTKKAGKLDALTAVVQTVAEELFRQRMNAPALVNQAPTAAAGRKATKAQDTSENNDTGEDYGEDESAGYGDD